MIIIKHNGCTKRESGGGLYGKTEISNPNRQGGKTDQIVVIRQQIELYVPTAATSEVEYITEYIVALIQSADGVAILHIGNI
ncbi:hypothetical protein QWY85_05730 [Neolewinella lacunae]|uniref:hypothetical protein n=1 Tax=Neolewinella lacunae TaxID=1517758 RepID=UPI0025B4CF80|nr:hypothetical protein [Neolewinella lacunae]MDN3634151.1 hypothetical protein [Neolewinella lacunae]